MNNKTVNGKVIKRWYRENMAGKPKEVVGQLAVRTMFYRNELSKIVKSIFEIDCPIEWDIDYIKNSLLWRGYFIISQTPGYGILPIRGSLTGYNYIGNPTRAVMASPIIGDWQNTIGVDCEIMYIDKYDAHTFYKFNDLINITAEKLASADSAIEVNLINSKVAYVMEAETKAQADTIKDMVDKISQGEPLVVYRKDTLSQSGLQLLYGNVKNTYIANDVHDTKQAIMYEFLTSLGVNNANTDKRERLITSEVNANNMQLQANVDHWLENIERQNERIHKIFPELKWDLKLRYSHLFNQSNMLTNTEVKNDTVK